MKGTIITTVTAIVAGVLSTLIGGWDIVLEILLIVMALDYITGVASAFKRNSITGRLFFHCPFNGIQSTWPAAVDAKRTGGLGPSILPFGFAANR